LECAVSSLYSHIASVPKFTSVSSVRHLQGIRALHWRRCYLPEHLQGSILPMQMPTLHEVQCQQEDMCCWGLYRWQGLKSLPGIQEQWFLWSSFIYQVRIQCTEWWHWNNINQPISRRKALVNCRRTCGLCEKKETCYPGYTLDPVLKTCVGMLGIKI
jgi:hypothetical protein